MGCSHALGAEMWLDPELSDIPEPQEDFGLINSYPMRIARALGFHPLNHAISGGSNDAMFRIWAEQCHGLGPNDMVIACWTGGNRSEVWHEKDQMWVEISPGTEVFFKRHKDQLFLQGRCVGDSIADQDFYKQYIKYWQSLACDPVSAGNNKIKNILALNIWATQLGIRVLNFYSFEEMDNTILDQFEWPADQSFMQHANINGFTPTAWGHYFIDAHRSYADLVLESLHG